jgi:hypothetical protein
VVKSCVQGQGYTIDMVWYSDMGVIDHITNELYKLVVCENYTSQEQIHTTNGGGMHITHVGNSILHTPSHNLSLKNVLHVPRSRKNLVSIHHFIRDNHVFVEYHPWFFLVKDPATRRVLMHGKCRGGLYPFPSLEQSSSKCLLSVVRPSLR